MKKIMQKSAIVFLAFMLVVATGGFSIYSHFCNCAGKETASFFSDSSCQVEKAPAVESKCCNTEVPACCQEKAATKHDDSCKKDNCCNTSSRFIKISDDYTVSFGKLSLKFVIAFINILTGVTFQVEPKEVSTRIPDFNDTSPPLYGAELLHHIHQLKIAQPLV